MAKLAKKDKDTLLNSVEKRAADAEKSVESSLKIRTRLPKGVNDKTALIKLELGYFVGVDISSIYFDACINGKVLKFSQDEKGFALFLTCFSVSCRENVWVVMEATGGYESKLAHYLVENGLKVSIVNPYYLRSYGISKGVKAKTDALDAKVIGDFGRMLYGEDKLISWQVPSLEQKAMESALNLSEILASRIQEDKNRLNSLLLIPNAADFAIKMLQESIANNEKHLEEVEIQINNFTQTHEEEVKLLQSIPGIGKKTIPILVLLLCINKEFTSAKAICSFIGLDPIVFKSGTTVNKKGKIRKKGYGRLRTLLYMCAISAKKHNKACKQLYERLMAKGKPKKVALIAVANKLIKQVFAILMAKSEYKDDYQRPQIQNPQNMSKSA